MYRLQKAQHTPTPTAQPLLLPRTQSQREKSLVGEGANHAEQASPSDGAPHGDVSEVLNAFTQIPHPSTVSRQPAFSSTSPTTPETIDSLNLPSYISRPRRKFKPEELEYLKNRGALSVPGTTLRNQLFLSFVMYVYPFLPVLDLQDFIFAIEGQPRTEVSLILFQAVMFAGTAFVDAQSLVNAGFEDRVAARAYFFEKVKVSS